MQLKIAVTKPARKLVFQNLVFGGAEEDRTPDPLLAKQVLSQLSYSPITDIWWAREDSNL